MRSRFPELTAEQVVNRLTASARRSARAPSNLVGAGAVDPVAALTWDLPGSDVGPEPVAGRRIAAPAPQPPKDTTPRTVALTGTAVLAVAAMVAAAITTHRRRDAP